ncbi:GntR family transcriptional regulator [Luedemannella flava]
MFVFRLDSGSGVPPYLQLVHQVRQAVLLGFLRPGDRLPLIREVVETLAINPNTVAKAYRQLEQEQLVTGRPGQGTFVNEAPSAGLSPAASRRCAAAWPPGCGAPTRPASTSGPSRRCSPRSTARPGTRRHDRVAD